MVIIAINFQLMFQSEVWSAPFYNPFNINSYQFVEIISHL